MARDGDGRARIVDAAREIFAEKGFSGARVKEIAQRAGVSQALIFYNFPDKESIFREILSKFEGELVEAFLKIFPTERGIDEVGRWGNSELWEGMEFFAEKSRIWRILLHEALASEEGQKAFIGVWDSLNEKARRRLLVERGFELGRGDSEREVVDFFFIYVPAIAITLIGKQWTSAKGYDERIVKENFTRVINALYARFLSAS